MFALFLAGWSPVFPPSVQSNRHTGLSDPCIIDLYKTVLETHKVDKRSEGADVMNLHHKCEVFIKKKIATVICTNNCDDGQVLFMDVSLHSMCQSESLGTGDGVDMSLITGVSLKYKVRYSL